MASTALAGRIFKGLIRNGSWVQGSILRTTKLSFLPGGAARCVTNLSYPLKLASVSADHAAFYEESLKNPDQFWGDLARRRLRWIKDFDQVVDCDMTDGRFRWFTGGILNVTGNWH